jgi:hypothetical protein
MFNVVFASSPRHSSWRRRLTDIDMYLLRCSAFARTVWCLVFNAPQGRHMHYVAIGGERSFISLAERPIESACVSLYISQHPSPPKKKDNCIYRKYLLGCTHMYRYIGYRMDADVNYEPARRQLLAISKKYGKLTSQAYMWSVRTYYSVYPKR